MVGHPFIDQFTDMLSVAGPSYRFISQFEALLRAMTVRGPSIDDHFSEIGDLVAQ